MRIRSKAVLTIIATPEPSTINGKKYYRFAILSNGEAGNISCSEDAYNAVGHVSEGQFVPAIAELVYNDAYKSMSIASVSLNPLQASPAPPASAPSANTADKPTANKAAPGK